VRPRLDVEKAISSADIYEILLANLVYDKIFSRKFHPFGSLNITNN